MKPTRDMLQRVGAIEAAARVPNEPNRILAVLSDHELDRLEAALVAGDAPAAAEITAAAEQRLAAGTPPWEATPEAARARAAEHAAYWELVADALKTGAPIDYPKLEREARRLAAEAERSTQ